MAQTRFIGVNQDITQSIMLLLTSTLTRSGVVSGLASSIQLPSNGNFQISLNPGKFILPDGMLVQEDKLQTFPLSVGVVGGKYTLVAYRDLESGSQSDIVRYAILQNFVTQSTITPVANRVYLPLTWIQQSGNSGTLQDFWSQDLGVRNQAIQKSYRTPFNNLVKVSNVAAPTVLVETVTNQYLQSQKVLASVVSPGIYNLVVESVPGCIPSEVLLIGKGINSTPSNVAYESLNGQALTGSIKGLWVFPTNFTSNRLTYSLTFNTNWGLTEDLIKLTIQTTLELLEVLVTWVPIQ